MIYNWFDVVMQYDLMQFCLSKGNYKSVYLIKVSSFKFTFTYFRYLFIIKTFYKSIFWTLLNIIQHEDRLLIFPFKIALNARCRR
jgi:hypothetical protein